MDFSRSDPELWLANCCWKSGTGSVLVSQGSALSINWSSSQRGCFLQRGSVSWFLAPVLGKLGLSRVKGWQIFICPTVCLFAVRLYLYCLLSFVYFCLQCWCSLCCCVRIANLITPGRSASAICPFPSILFSLLTGF